MPPRAAIGDRARIEAELSREARLFLAECCRLRELSRVAWQADDDLNRLFTLTAVQLRAERLEVEAGVSAGVALREASVYCGADPETITRLLRRRRRARRKPDVTSSPTKLSPTYRGTIPPLNARRAAP